MLVLTTAFPYFCIRLKIMPMFTVIGCMLGGMATGFVLRRQNLSWIGKAITVLIWILLFLLGLEVGNNRQIIEGLATLGIEALIITLACLTGSCLLAWGLWRWLYKRKGGKA
jgi:uncharacterized membrane protein YbjE (DUF340 family)